MFADKDPSIAGMVLDSPFSSLSELSLELARKHSSIPEWIVGIVLSYIKKTIKEQAGFDITEINPLKNNAPCSFVPAYFICASDDELIDPTHTKRLHAAYTGEKIFKEVDGTHNSERDQTTNDSIAIFFHNVLRVDELCIKKEEKKGLTDIEQMEKNWELGANHGYLDEGDRNFFESDENCEKFVTGAKGIRGGLANNEKFNKQFLGNLQAGVFADKPKVDSKPVINKGDADIERYFGDHDEGSHNKPLNSNCDRKTDLSRIGGKRSENNFEDTRESMDDEEKEFFYGKKKDPNQEIEEFFGNTIGGKK